MGSKGGRGPLTDIHLRQSPFTDQSFKTTTFKFDVCIVNLFLGHHTPRVLNDLHCAMQAIS
jgi:hypothetical protein